MPKRCRASAFGPDAFVNAKLIELLHVCLNKSLNDYHVDYRQQFNIHLIPSFLITGRYGLIAGAEFRTQQRYKRNNIGTLPHTIGL